ncbi:chorismate mutase [Methylopila sp. 73B]|uniref:chorismate mutase n=1 Tax=Methylopila sp. 73B TaxID=1120792 RepID=UPI00037CB5C8|nr:chorismate mutase [Methylopila sp. 73B]
MNRLAAVTLLVVGGLALAGGGGAFAQAGADTGSPAFWGKPTADGGTCCQTLGEVRANIDRIDAALIALMAERGAYVHEAARFKQNPEAVEDKARVEAIIRKVRTLATERRLNPDVAEQTYRAMIAKFTEDERRAAAEMMRDPAAQ